MCEILLLKELTEHGALREQSKRHCSLGENRIKHARWHNVLLEAKPHISPNACFDLVTPSPGTGALAMPSRGRGVFGCREHHGAVGSYPVLTTPRAQSSCGLHTHTHTLLLLLDHSGISPRHKPPGKGTTKLERNTNLPEQSLSSAWVSRVCFFTSIFLDNQKSRTACAQKTVTL